MNKAHSVQAFTLHQKNGMFLNCYYWPDKNASVLMFDRNFQT